MRGFLQISQKKLPKRAFRAMLPPNFTERASKTSVSRDASDNSHRKASKMIISCEASSKFHRTVLPKRAFRAMLPTIFTQNLRFATVSRDRHTDSCERVHPPKAKCASHYSIPKCDNVRFATAACAKMYESIDREPTRFVFTERVHREQMKFSFRYSFGRSAPRFYREG